MVKSPLVNSRIGRVTPWRSLSEWSRLPSAKSCFLGGACREEPRPEGRSPQRTKQSDAVPPGAGNGPKRVTGQAREKPGSRVLHGTYRRSVAEQDDSARRHAAETSLCHDDQGWPAKTATAFGPLRLGTAIPAERRMASWPYLRAAMGHGDRLVMGSEIDHSNAWSARNRTMVSPRGFTASSLFFTWSRKT